MKPPEPWWNKELMMIKEIDKAAEMAMKKAITALTQISVKFVRGVHTRVY